MNNPMNRHSILVVEDETLLAIDMAEILASTAANDVVTATTIDQAERELRPDLDFAVLDIEVIGGRTFDLARRILAAGAQVLFVTGAVNPAVPEDLAEVPLLTKPYRPDQLKRAFYAALKEKRIRKPAAEPA